jgi:hypothetical protein
MLKPFTLICNLVLRILKNLQFPSILGVKVSNNKNSSTFSELTICDSYSIEKCELCSSVFTDTSPYLLFRYNKISLKYDKIIKSPRISFKVSYSYYYYLILACSSNISCLKHRLFFTKIPRILMQIIRSRVFFRKLMHLSRSPCIGMVIARTAKIATNQKSYSYAICRGH